MAKQLGREVILQISDGGGVPVYTTLAGGQSVTVTDTVEPIDATVPDAANRDGPPAQEVFPGKRNVQISGTFLLVDDAAETALVTVSTSDTRKQGFRATIPDFKTYTADFLLSELSYEGAIDGMAQYSITLESDGAVTVADV